FGGAVRGVGGRLAGHPRSTVGRGGVCCRGGRAAVRRRPAGRGSHRPARRALDRGGPRRQREAPRSTALSKARRPVTTYAPHVLAACLSYRPLRRILLR